ncbi:tyrosine-type recombinase/integrase [Mycobacterium sp. Z3061]
MESHTIHLDYQFCFNLFYPIRTIYMVKKVRETQKSYLRVRNNTDYEYLFYSNRGKKLNRTTVNKLFERYSEWLSVEISPHDLRHFFCGHTLELGMSIHEVAIH